MAAMVNGTLRWMREIYQLVEGLSIELEYRRQETTYLREQLSNVLDQLSHIPEVSDQVLSIKKELENIEWVKDKKELFEVLDEITQQMMEESKEQMMISDDRTDRVSEMPWEDIVGRWVSKKLGYSVQWKIGPPL